MTSRDNINFAYDRINQYKDDSTSGNELNPDYDGSDKELVNILQAPKSNKRPEVSFFIAFKEFCLKTSVWIFLTLITIGVGILILLDSKVDKVISKQDDVNSKVEKISEKLNNMDKDYNSFFHIIIDRLKR